MALKERAAKAYEEKEAQFPEADSLPAPLYLLYLNPYVSAIENRNPETGCYLKSCILYEFWARQHPLLLTHNIFHRLYRFFQTLPAHCIYSVTDPLLATRRGMTIQEATEEIGISRSSFYKYKDDIFPFHENEKGRTVTMVIQLDDTPGVMAELLNAVARYQAQFMMEENMFRYM